MNKLAILLAGLLTVASAARAQNLIVNGDFNTTAAHSAQITNSNLPGWTKLTPAGSSGAFAVVYLPGEATTLGATGTGDGALLLKLWAVTESPVGGSYVAIDGDPVANSILQQTVHGLTAGQAYDLNFWYAAGQFTTRTGDTTEWWEVKLGNGPAQTTTVLNTPSQGFNGWYNTTMTFVAGGTDEVLSFLSLGTPAGLPPVVLLDGVSMTAAVPEPGAWLLMAMGLGLLAGLRYRHRAQN